MPTIELALKGKTIFFYTSTPSSDNKGMWVSHTDQFSDTSCMSYSSILFSTASKASQNSHKVISFLSLSSSLDQLSFAFGLSYCMCYFLHLRGQVFFTFLGEHNRLYNLLLVPVVNPFRGDVPPPCAFLACLLYVPEDFHRFHVHFRSALTWHLSTSPGTPSLLTLDALPQTLIWKTR